MKMTICRDFEFSAAHWLPLVPPEHKCHRMHGHNYTVRVFVRGELDGLLGWVRDFGMVKERTEALIAQLDHVLLNSISGLSNPTAELLAAWLVERLLLVEPLLFAVEVQEKGSSGVRLTVEDFHG